MGRLQFFPVLQEEKMLFALSMSRLIDRLLSLAAGLGAWCVVVLVIAVCYDVLTRYFGIPKLFGLTSIILHEAEYWLHSFAIVLTIGYAYMRQRHVRIDLVRDNCSLRTKYFIESIGCLIFVVPYSVLGIWLSIPYVYRSWSIGESSRSGNGIDSVWIVKSGLIVLFFLILLAALSILIKAVAGLSGRLPREKVTEVVGGGES